MRFHLISAFVTFFVVVDPVGVAVVTGGMTHGLPKALRHSIAWRGVAIAGAILIVFAFVGEALLRALGITLPALRVAGGLLLFLLSIDMVFARPSGIRNPTGPEQAEANQRVDIAVFPLAFPLLAGPGALTSVVLLMARADDSIEAAIVIGALIVVLGLAYLSLHFTNEVGALLGVTGANVVGRIAGVILAALAAQFVLDGIGQGLPRPG
jgi:multiple antibiotic resistance protein